MIYAVNGESFAARAVSMVVSANRGVGRVDFIDGYTANSLIQHPFLELGVGGQIILHETERTDAVGFEIIQHHLIESLAAFRVTIFQLALGLSSSFDHSLGRFVAPNEIETSELIRGIGTNFCPRNMGIG